MDFLRRRWPLCLGIPLALSVLARPLGNPDLFWHLSAGRWIAAHGAVPRADFLSYLPTQSWVDFEWLSQLLYYLAYAGRGLAGVWLLKTLVLGALFALFLSLLEFEGQGRSGQAVGLVLLAAALLPSADVRPENWSLLLFTVQLYWLERERRSGPGTEASRWLAAFGLYALWANLHGGYPIGLALIGLYALGSDDLTKFWRTGSLALAGAAGTLVNPYGPGLYAVMFEHARGMSELSTYIIEWKPVSPRNTWALPFWLIAALVPPALAWARRRGQPSIPRAHLLVLAFLGAACWKGRNSPFFCIAALAYLARLAGRLSPLWVAPSCAAGIVFFSLFAWPQFRRPPWTPQGFPEQAAAFLKREKPFLGAERLYNPYGWGGYLGWKLAPDYKVLWDGRYLFQDLLPEEHQAKQSPESWAAFLDKQQVQVVVLEHVKLSIAGSAEKGAPARPFYVFFMPQKDWALVHWDAGALVFARRSFAPKAWLESREFRFLRPGDEDWVKMQIEAGRLRREDLRHDAELALRSLGETKS